VHNEIKRHVNSETAHHYFVQKLLTPDLLSKIVNMLAHTHKRLISSVVLYG
jgi:hypothetical protein